MLGCPYCGEEILPGDEQCESCGMSLTGFDSEPQPESLLELERAIMREPISVLEPPLAVFVSPTDSVHKAVTALKSMRQGAIHVMDGEDLVGIFTERDVLLRLAVRGIDAENTPIVELMSPDPVTLREDHTMAHAVHLMGVNNFRHLPIKFDDGWRMLTAGELMGYLATHLPDQNGHTHRETP